MTTTVSDGDYDLIEKTASATTPDEVMHSAMAEKRSGFEAADSNGKANELQRELEDLVQRQDTSANEIVSSIPATLLRVSVQLPPRRYHETAM